MESAVEKLYLLRRKIKDLQEEEEELKDKIVRVLAKNNTKKLNTEDYCLTVVSGSRRTLSKKDCPSDIWEKYSKEHSYQSVLIKKQTARRSRSPSSPSSP